MSPPPKKIGFIGFGRVVEWHLEQIKNLNIEIVFICDTSEEKIRKAQLLKPSSIFFKNISDLIESKKLEVDYCVIATPSGGHFEIAKKLFLSGKKWNLLIEKPTFLNYEHFHEAKNWDINIIPIFQNRYNISVRKAKEFLSNGVLGELHYASLSLDWCRPQRYYDQASWRGTWLEDGGVSTNQGIHYFDITRHLLGDFLNVHAFMKRLSAKIECEDYLIAFFNLEIGIPLDVRMTTSGRHSKESASLSIHGSKGSLKLHGICCNKLITDLQNQNDMFFGEDVEIAYGYGHKDLFRLISEDNCDKNISLPTLKESLNTMKYIFSSYESAISGRISTNKEIYKENPLGRSSKKVEFYND